MPHHPWIVGSSKQLHSLHTTHLVRASLPDSIGLNLGPNLGEVGVLLLAVEELCPLLLIIRVVVQLENYHRR